MSKARDIADLDFNSPDIDGGNIDGATIGGTTPAAGSFSQVNVDRIEAPSNFTIDAGGEIYLDAATAGVVRLLKNTSNYGAFFLDANNFTIKSEIADQDFLIAGNDGGSTVHALKLDMSLGGTAIFNNNVGIGQAPTAFSNWRVLELKAGSAGAMLNYENSSSARVAALAYDEGSAQFRMQTMVDADIKFEPNNAVALTLDGSQNATFNGTVETGGTLYIPQWIEHSGDSNTYFGFPSGDEFKIVTANVGRLHIKGSGTIFNEGGEDVDFRVESSGNENMLFVDGGNNTVGIGTTASVDETLTVAGEIRSSGNGGAVRVDSGSGGYYLNLTQSYAHPYSNSYIQSVAGSSYHGRLIFEGNTSGGSMEEFLRMSTAEGVIFNEDGIDKDFRVESNSNSNMLFVDGGTNRVGVGRGNPIHPLHVNGTLAVGVGGTSANDVTGTLNIGGDGTYYMTQIKTINVTSNPSILNARMGFFTLSGTGETASDSTEKMSILAGNGNVGIGNNNPAQKLSVAGSVWASGYYITNLQGNSQLTSASTSSGSLASYIGQGLISVTVSDKKVKENFGGVETNECLNKVVSLAEHVKKFDWIDEDWKKEKGRTVGMVAQEIYEDHSEFVHKPENYDDDGWAIRYQEIVPTLTKAIQEQQTLIETLTARITALEN